MRKPSPYMTTVDRQVDVLENFIGSGWHRPMDVGGTNGSHHSRTLKQLWEKGILECKGRASFMYRLKPGYRADTGI